MSRGRRVGRRSRRLRPGILVWASCAGAALVLTLGANGTLSSWTQAVIVNSNSSVATAKAVVLQETGPTSQGSPVCTSGSVPSNSSTCATVNKYGGTATPLLPGSTATTDVTFTNTGAANGTSFVLTPGACTQTPTAAAGPPAVANLCTNGDLTVTVSCSPGGSYNSASAWTDLTYTAAAPPTAAKTHPNTSNDLVAGAFWTCRFSVALLVSAGVADQGITVTQPLTWTLNG